MNPHGLDPDAGLHSLSNPHLHSLSTPYQVDASVEDVGNGRYFLRFAALDVKSKLASSQWTLSLSEDEARDLMWRIEAAIERRDWKNPYLRDDERYLPE